jgi:uncharacterized protein (UPF0548 family)
LFFLSTPSDEKVVEILARVSREPFTHPHVEQTRNPLAQAPKGFVLHRYGTQLGVGDEVFERACQVLLEYKHYPPSFTRVVRATPTLEAGQVFGTLATHFGFASLHPCRVVYVIREERPRRFGFALGTLPGHIGAGEECFLLSQVEPGGEVRFEIQAFSRPDGFWARVGGGIFAMFQRRFQRESLDEMKRQCGG